MNELALFAGAGGGILGGKLLGWRTVCAVEFDPYAASVLVARQNDGILPPFPVWDDVRTFDGRPWRGVADVVSGGFPCQDISAAGRGAGIEIGERSGLWREMARIVREVRPGFVFVENSPVLTSRGLGPVLGDLAAMGFDAEWGVLGAADVGAPHQRDRIWIVAYRDGLRKLQPQGREREQWGRVGNGGEDVADTDEIGRRGRPRMLGPGGRVESENSGDVSDAYGDHAQGVERGEPDQKIRGVAGERQIGSLGDGEKWWAVEPDVGRVAHGVAARVDRLKCLGNGQVPACAAEAFRRLCERMMEV